MRLIYFDFGEPRIVYGSAASMLLKGHEVYIVKQNNIKSFKKYLMEVEVGIEGCTEKAQIPLIDVPIRFSGGKLISEIYNYVPQLKEVILSMNPDILIVGSRHWIIAKKIANHLNVPLIFWQTVVPGIFKLPVFIKYGQLYSRIFTAPLGFIYNLLVAQLSSYVITNDMKTEQTFKSFGISNVKTIWPTYTRFLKKGAYSEFMKDKEGSDITSWEIPTDYVLSLITLEKGSHSYKIEQRALNFLKNVAIQVPNIDFIVIGASLKDVEKPTEFEHLKNFKLIGRIYDDSQMAELYRNAICVLCPIYIPGFSNRLFEAFFYGKVVISPYLVNEYYVGLQSGTNIIFTNDSITAAKIIKNIMLKDYVKKRIEEEARKYYLRNFSPKRHAEDLEQIIYHIVSGKDYVD